MNLKNLLDYANSVYQFGEKINNIERENKNCLTRPGTVLKTLVCARFTGTKSINQMVIASNKEFKGIYAKNEYVPKTHALRDCLNDFSSNEVKDIHDDIIQTLINNKYFDNHKYRGHGVLLVDGVEFFETKKDIEGLHIRKHKDGNIGHYYKALGLMYLSDTENIMLDLVPFEENEVKDDTEHNAKVKAEGEITVFKKAIPDIKKKNNGIDLIVGDCMFLNAPCFNCAKGEGMDVIAKLTDTRRTLYKDAKGLFEKSPPHKEYEVVEIFETTLIKYSKESKKKNTQNTDKYTIVREVTDKPLNEKILISEKEIEHPKKIVKRSVSEKVIKRIEAWTDVFQMDNYEYNDSNVKVIRVIEKTANKISDDETEKETEKVNEMYIVTTILDDDVEFIVDLMHRRWDIELKGFRKFKDRYNLDHLCVGILNAIKIIMYLSMIIFNLVELYFNVRTKKHKKEFNFVTLTRTYLIEIQGDNNFYRHFVT